MGRINCAFKHRESGGGIAKLVMDESRHKCAVLVWIDAVSRHAIRKPVSKLGHVKSYEAARQVCLWIRFERQRTSKLLFSLGQATHSPISPR